MKNFTLLLFLLSILIVSCEDVITIDPNTSEPRLVVDASMLWYKGFTGESQVITLSTSTGFYDEEIPMVSDAIVTVTDSSGQVFTFTEGPKFPGIYVCNNFLPELWGTYTLNVTYKGQNYTATETMYPVPDLLYTTQEYGGISGNSPIIKAFFLDPAEEQNFYMQRCLRTDKRSQTVVFDDEFVNGNETFTFIFFEDLPHNVPVEIQLMGISERYYNYMNKIYMTVSETNAGPFETAPADIRGNIINRSNPNDFAYGYFRLSEVSQIEHITD